MTAAVLAMTDADYEPRYCADRISGGVIHDFLKNDLADDEIIWLIPRCQESASAPAKQPQLLMRADAPARAQACTACSSLRRRDRIVRCPLIWRR